MYIEINDNTLLREIQEIFSDYYPYLQINFYKKGHKQYELSEEKDRIDPSAKVKDIKKTHVSGILEMLPLNTVTDVEKEFQQRFGLSVQILRKEKTGWVQTSGMDDFTLKELNEMGRNSSDEYIVSDYEEGFDDNKDKPDKLY